jgi:hypothetical protein
VGFVLCSLRRRTTPSTDTIEIPGTEILDRIFISRIIYRIFVLISRKKYLSPRSEAPNTRDLFLLALPSRSPEQRDFYGNPKKSFPEAGMSTDIQKKSFPKVGMFLFGMSVEFVTVFLAHPRPPGQIFFVKNSLIDFLVLVHT